MYDKRGIRAARPHIIIIIIIHKRKTAKFVELFQSCPFLLLFLVAYRWIIVDSWMRYPRMLLSIFCAGSGELLLSSSASLHPSSLYIYTRKIINKEKNLVVCWVGASGFKTKKLARCHVVVNIKMPITLYVVVEYASTEWLQFLIWEKFKNVEIQF